MHQLKSIYKYTLITSMFVLGIGSGIGTSYLLNGKEEQRFPASPSKQFVPFEHAKSSLPVKVEIAKNISIPETETDEVIITGRILTTLPPEGHITYRWEVPGSVQVLEGETSSELSNVQQGQLIEVRLRVKGFSKESQSAISLQAKTRINGTTLGGSDIIVSRAEDTLEGQAAELKKEADAQLKGIGSRSE